MSLNHTRIEPLRSSEPGVLLIDSSLRPISLNTEAIQILTYAGSSPKVRSIDSLLSEKIKSALLRYPSLPQSPFLTEFVSGRRRYICRVFALTLYSKRSYMGTQSLLLERNYTPSIDFYQMAKQLYLTPRERETVELLIQGLTSNEIADRMRISPNTVKAFFRSVMIKMGVSTHLGIIRKIIKTQD